MKESLLALGSSLIMILSISYPSHSSPAATPLSYANFEDSAYLRVITERAGKITGTLGLPDSAAFLRVRSIIANQYYSLNTVYTERDEHLKSLKTQTPAPDKTTMDSAKKGIQEVVDTRVGQLHSAYLAKLATELNQQQIDKVKDGMTYSVLEVTYHGYQEELPDLTEEQKARILADLTEAREHAMDAESSEKKHAWFGKYKGRINNYLSAQGIDMKKAAEEWEKRRKATADGQTN
jgi:Protein of unknown function (DUF3826)